MNEATQELSQPPTPSLIGGRYRVIAHLAHGGMATIYLGKQVGIEGFEHPVVLKRMHPHLLEATGATESLLEEALIAASIRHPNVVEVLDVISEEHEFFVVMEYLDGESLADLVAAYTRRQEPIPLTHAACIVAEAGAGLHAAHEIVDDQGNPQSLVHRDISPQNIFLTYRGHVKLLDFGIAKVTARASQTQTGHLKGKFPYLSPEQALGQELDRRSDIFSLGIVLWELIAGKRLFFRESELLTLRAVGEDEIPPLRSVRSDCPEELERIAMRALDRDRDQRYSTVEEMCRDLREFIGQGAAYSLEVDQLSQVMHSIFAEGMQRKRGMLSDLSTAHGIDFRSQGGAGLPMPSSASSRLPGSVAGQILSSSASALEQGWGLRPRRLLLAATVGIALGLAAVFVFGDSSREVVAERGDSSRTQLDAPRGVPAARRSPLPPEEPMAVATPTVAVAAKTNSDEVKSTAEPISEASAAPEPAEAVEPASSGAADEPENVRPRRKARRRSHRARRSRLGRGTNSTSPTGRERDPSSFGRIDDDAMGFHRMD